MLIEKQLVHGRILPAKCVGMLTWVTTYRNNQDHVILYQAVDDENIMKLLDY